MFLSGWHNKGAQQTPPPAAAYATDLLKPVLCCHLANATDSELWPVITKNDLLRPADPFTRIDSKLNQVVPWSLHTFPENFMQIGPAVFS